MKKKGGKLKWIVIIIIVIAVLGAVFGGGDSEDTADTGSKTTTEKEITYEKVSASKLSKVLEKNAAKASKEYKGKYLEVTGELGTIDSDMSYICVSTEDDFDLTNIQCYIQNEEQEEKILDMEQGDKITVKGKCTDVGEVLGYSIDIDSIK